MTGESRCKVGFMKIDRHDALKPGRASSTVFGPA